MNKEGDKMVTLCFQDTNTICYIHFFQMKWSNKTKYYSGRFAEMKIGWKSDWNYEWTFSEQQKENILEIWLNVICVKKPQGGGEVRVLILC